ncbi:MAG: hypothetical protein HZB47_08420 [Nitrosomonadales bacterium]|nr:hypothetical protein [Nitrosomonadales bacterium]
MKRAILVPAILLIGSLSGGNADAAIGIESETLTFLNKGYHGSVWYGSGGKRIRFVYSRVTFPEAFSPEGFTNLTARFKEFEFDFFVGEKRDDFRGLWIAVGGGRTDMSIESKTTGATATISTNDFHTGTGYAAPIANNFYVNPWIGADVHLNAPDNVQVGTETWHPRKVDLVGGIKLGFDF